jgi:protein-tyrosine phosphatase
MYASKVLDPMSCTVLFLCTGNYYRSRFAEELFNHLAAEAGLGWEAASRGIALERGLHNVGPISPHVLQGLEALGVAVRGAERFPAAAQEVDLALADRIIALKEEEHRPLLQERFPQWASRVEYWHIDDLYDTPAGQAVPEMERNVADLIRRLSAGDERHGGTGPMPATSGCELEGHNTEI